MKAKSSFRKRGNRNPYKSQINNLEIEVNQLRSDIKNLEKKKRSYGIVILEIIGLLIAGLVACQVFMQTEYMQKQTTILANQEQLIEDQNLLFAKQNEKIDSQNSMFGRQNKLFKNQNKLVSSQNEKIDFQNELFDTQNKRIEQQTYLQEAERRGSLVFLFNNVLDKIDNELKTPSNIERKLSTELIGRIISLSQALKPYNYLKNDEILDKPISPERGQLLVSLVNSNLDSNTYELIFKKSNFSYSELEGIDLKGAYLKNINLSFANLDSAMLNKADFSSANLNNASFTKAFVDEVKFFGTLLVGTNFKDAYVRNTKILHCELSNTNFEGAYLNGSILDSKVTLKLFYDQVKEIPIDSIESYNRRKYSENKEFTIFKSPKNQIFYSGKIPYYFQIINNTENTSELGINTMIGDSRIVLKNVNFRNAYLSRVKLKNYWIESCNFSSAFFEENEFNNLILVKSDFNNSTFGRETILKYFESPQVSIFNHSLGSDYTFHEKTDFHPNILKYYKRVGKKFYNLKLKKI